MERKYAVSNLRMFYKNMRENRAEMKGLLCLSHMMTWRLIVCGPTGQRFEFAPPPTPVVCGWVNKDLGVSSRVCVTCHIKDAVPLIERSRAWCPSGRFPPSFIHQVIIITGLN